MRRMVIVCGSVAALAGVGGSAFAAVPGLGQFVLKTGEETGFKPAKPKFDRTIKAWVHGDPAKQAKSETRHLKAEGFVAGVVEHTHQIAGKGEGLSTAMELGSPADAKRELSYEIHSGIAAQGKRATIHRFKVKGVAGAVGFTATEAPHPGGAANTYWTEGRCVLLVGDYLPKGSAGALAAPVKAGVAAIDKRTGASCG